MLKKEKVSSSTGKHTDRNQADGEEICILSKKLTPRRWRQKVEVKRIKSGWWVCLQAEDNN